MTNKGLHFLLLLVIIGCQSRTPLKSNFIGRPLPSFSVLLTDSVTYVNPASIANNNSTILYYLRPDCPFCRAEMQTILDDIKQLQNVNLLVFTNSSLKEMKSFYTHFNLNKYPNVFAGIDYSNFFENFFRVQSVPYIAVFGKDKRLNNIFIGKTSVIELEKEVQQ